MNSEISNNQTYTLSIVDHKAKLQSSIITTQYILLSHNAEIKVLNETHFNVNIFVESLIKSLNKKLKESIQSHSGSIYISSCDESNSTNIISNAKIKVLTQIMKICNEYFTFDESSIRFSANIYFEIIGICYMNKNKNIISLENDGTVHSNDFILFSHSTNVISLPVMLLSYSANPNSNRSILSNKELELYSCTFLRGNFNNYGSINNMDNYHNNGGVIEYDNHNNACKKIKIASGFGNFDMYFESYDDGATNEMWEQCEYINCLLSSKNPYYYLHQEAFVWLSFNNDQNTHSLYYLGNNSNNVNIFNYSLTNNELNNINISSLTLLYLSDTESYSTNGLQFNSNSYIVNVYITNNEININLISWNNIIFTRNSSLLLNANTNYQLVLQTNKNCQNKYRNSSLSICPGCNYYGSDISTNNNGYIYSSDSIAIISKQCPSTYFMLIGNITIPSADNLNLTFHSYDGSIYISSYYDDSAIEISEGCLSNYSMPFGGITLSSDLNTYNLNLFAGFDQSTKLSQNSNGLIVSYNMFSNW